MALPKPDYATRNMKLVGYSDQGGRCDGVQIMVHRGYAYVGHIFSKGFSVIDVRDPKKPKLAKYVAAPPNTWTLHLQAHDDLLLVIHNKDMFAQAEMADEKNYYKGKVSHHAKPKAAVRDWSAGMAVYDISKPDDLRQIGFMPVDGTGLHRLWYVGGRWAYASALLDGFSDYILITIDLKNPKKPKLAGKYWLPGMNVAAGEKAKWPTKNGRFGLHHAIIHDDIAYCSWRDACLAVVDVKNKSKPKLITHKVWAPPFGGGTHNALPLPDRNLLIVVDETVLDNQEDGFKPIWVFDARRSHTGQRQGRHALEVGRREPGAYPRQRRADHGSRSEGCRRRSEGRRGRPEGGRSPRRRRCGEHPRRRHREGRQADGLRSGAQRGQGKLQVRPVGDAR